MISVGYELNNAIAGWSDALVSVPDDSLSRAYDRATANWDWQDTRHPFTGDAIAQAYRDLADEDQKRAADERRKAARRNPDTYKCWHCSDIGYQQIFVREHGLWYSSARPCSCEIAPVSQRSQLPVQEPAFIRNKLGQYVKRADLIKYGAPNGTFQSFDFAGKEGEQ